MKRCLVQIPHLKKKKKQKCSKHISLERFLSGVSLEVFFLNLTKETIMSVMSDLHLQIHELYTIGVKPEDIAHKLDVTTDWVYEALSMTMFVDMLSEDNDD